MQEVQYVVIEENSMDTLIADTRSAKSVVMPDTLEYYANTIEPILVDLSIKRIITITREKLLTNPTNKKWQDATKTLALYQVNTVEEAEKLMHKVPS